MEILRKAHSIGLYVCNVTSDMGSPNRALWSTLGIGVTRFTPPCSSITHPIEADKKLYFMADVPHLIKNLKSALCKNVICLENQIISIEPVKTLANFEAEKKLNLAPSLKLSHIESSHFDKMKVSSALHVISRSVAAGIRTLVSKGWIEESATPTFRATADFIDLMNNWFDLMCSRNPGLALSKLHPKKYDEAVALLRRVVYVMSNVRIGDGQWKPIQTGIILSTVSVLGLSEEIFKMNIAYLMTGRLSQDCLENLFSSLRLKSPVPSPIEFRNNLKIIAVAQFLKTPSNTSYNLDDSQYLADFLETPKTPTSGGDELPVEVVVDSSVDCCIDESEYLALYYLAGWSIKALDTENHCTCMLESSVSSPDQNLAEFSLLSELKEYKKDCLHHPSVKAFKMLTSAEKLFRQWSEVITEVKNPVEYIIEKIMPELKEFVFTCPKHDTKKLLLKKFYTLRLHIECKRITQFISAKNGLGSKSMAMRLAVRKYK